MIKIDFYIKYSDKEIFRIPVVPANFTISAGNNTQNITVSNVGELSLWGPEKLKAISIQSFFPYYYNSSYCSYKNFKKPWECVDLINKWRNSGSPVRLIITDKSKNVDINLEMLIETIDSTMQDASGDVYYTLAFREYKRVNIEKVSAPTNPSNPPSTRPKPPTVPSNPPNTQRKYTVVSGDTLWGISKRFYGDGSQYPKIVSANNIANPSLIYPGQILIIP